MNHIEKIMKKLLEVLFNQKTFGLSNNRIPYKGIEHINLVGNILNFHHVDPQDWEKTIERWEK